MLTERLCMLIEYLRVFIEYLRVFIKRLLYGFNGRLKFLARDLSHVFFREHTLDDEIETFLNALNLLNHGDIILHHL